MKNIFQTLLIRIYCDIVDAQSSHSWFLLPEFNACRQPHRLNVKYKPSHLEAVQIDDGDVVKDRHRDVDEGKEAVSEVKQTDE